MTAINPENLKEIMTKNTYCVAKGATGATNHYWMQKDK